MTERMSHWRRMAAGGMLLALAGCVSPSPKAAFYSLAAGDEAAPAAAAAETAPSVGVVPVVLPGYLNRPQMVVRRGATIEFDEYHRWAGNLQRDFSQVLVTDLARALGSERVALYPLAADFAPAYRLAVDVDRFDGNPEQGVTLSGRWTLTEAATRRVLLVRQVSIVEPVSGEGMAALAEAHGRAVDRMARTIAEAIAAQPRAE